VDPDARVRASLDLLRPRLSDPPHAAVILGSGLGGIAERWSATWQLPLDEIPSAPAPRVDGHRGTLSEIRVGDLPVLVQEGRTHLYEGYEAADVAATVRLYAALGCKRLVLTCASGTLTDDAPSGALVAIRDHLNLTGANPLSGGEFVPMADAYRADLCPADLPRVVLAGLRGPSYETGAEAEMLRRLGADIVSMSTVLEAVAARAEGMEIVGLSAVTNRSGGGDAEPESHDRVVARATAMRKRLYDVLAELLPRWSLDLA